MTLRAWFLCIVFSGILLFPVAFSQAAIVPECTGSKCRLCDLVTLAQNIINFLIVISVFLAVFYIAVAGFKAVTSAGHGAGKIVWETVGAIAIGMLVALAAWLIIDTGLKILLGGEFGPWHTIECKDNPEFAKGGGGSGPTVVDTSRPSTGLGGAGNGTCQAIPSGACSASSLQQSGGSFGDANVATRMSAVCNIESRGDPNIQPTTDKLWNGGQGFSYGLFQINLTSTNSFQCNGQSLPCSSAFTLDPQYSNCQGRTSDPPNCWRQESWGRANAVAGFGKNITNQGLYDQCKAAVQNPTCNVAHAQKLYDAAGAGGNAMQPWSTTANKCGFR